MLTRVEHIFGDLQDTDGAPTPQAEGAAIALQGETKSVTEQWRAIPAEVALLNPALEAAGIDKLESP